MAGRAGIPVGRPLAFWDSSALVPLCVQQSATRRAVALFKSYDIVVWWATSVEIASALARLRRMGQIDSNQWTQATKLAMDLASVWSVIQPLDSLRGKAEQLIDRYDLTAADSLQLAAALEWCNDEPQGRTFLTADQRLREAALLRGFDAKTV